jgi:methylthioribulose-1-phosphate dehydratase
MNTTVTDKSPTWEDAAQSVITTGRRAYQRGWLPATSGNLSVRAENSDIAITRTGVDKGSLELPDILRQPLAQSLLPGSSAEAALHLRLYADHSDIGAVFHVHSLLSSVLGRLHATQGHIVLQGWEMQKAFAGVVTHETRVLLPVFTNSQDIQSLSGVIAKSRAQAAPDAVLAPGYVLAGHGIYAWGSDATQAWRHLEALDSLLTQVSVLTAHSQHPSTTFS